MNEQNYPGNSIRAQAAGQTPQKSNKVRRPETVDKVVTGHVQSKRTTFGDRIAERMTLADGRSIAENLLTDILIPAATDTVVTLIERAANMFFYGESGGRKKSVQNYDPNRAERMATSRMTTTVTKPTSRNIVDELIFDTRRDAEDVLDSLWETIEEYGVVSVKNLYEFANLKSNYTQDRWGWIDLPESEVRITHVRDGWRLELPRPIDIDKY